MWVVWFCGSAGRRLSIYGLWCLGCETRHIAQDAPAVSCMALGQEMVVREASYLI